MTSYLLVLSSYFTKYPMKLKNSKRRQSKNMFYMPFIKVFALLISFYHGLSKTLFGARVVKNTPVGPVVTIVPRIFLQILCLTYLTKVNVLGSRRMNKSQLTWVWECLDRYAYRGAVCLLTKQDGWIAPTGCGSRLMLMLVSVRGPSRPIRIDPQFFCEGRQSASFSTRWQISFWSLILYII